MARYPSGKGEVCKTFMRRFDSGPRLQLTSSQSLDYASRSFGLSPELGNTWEQNALQILDCASVSLWNRVSVDVECGSDCRVPKLFLRDLHGDTEVVKHRGMDVP